VHGKWLRILAIDIFLRERKGARWNIKRSAALQQTVTTPALVALLCHPRSTSPPSDLWSILYIRYFLLSIAPICLIYVSFRGHPQQRSPYVRLGLASSHPESTSRKIHPLFPTLAGQWILRRICSWCKHAAILKRYISAMPYRNGCAAALAIKYHITRTTHWVANKYY